MSSWLKNNIISVTFNSIRDYLSQSQKRRGLSLILFIILGAFMDVSGIAAILPIISVAVEPAILESGGWISKLYSSFKFSGPDSFLLAAILSLLVLFLVKNLLSIYLQFTQANYAAEVSNSLAETQFKHYFNATYQQIKMHSSNLLLTNIAIIPQTYSVGILMPALHWDVPALGQLCQR